MSKYTVAEISRDPSHPGNEAAEIFTKRLAAAFSVLDLMIRQYNRHELTPEQFTQFMRAYSGVSERETV